MTATWTAERIARLRQYVTAGLSCSQIAAEIGVTRNAVIGKIHRLGLSPGRKPATLARRLRTAPRNAPTRIARILAAVTNAPSVAAAIAEPAVVSARCSLVDLGGGRCRWPLSDPGQADFGFCGNDAVAGLSYCAGHARLAYRLPSGRRA